jgi:hypothetical protein
VTKPRELKAFTFAANHKSYDEFVEWAFEVDDGRTEVGWKDISTPDRRLLIGDERYKVFPGLTFIYLPPPAGQSRAGVFLRFAPYVFQTLFEVTKER